MTTAAPEPFRSRLGLSSDRADRVLLVAALGILSAVSPMATDLYLASIPEMGEFYGASAAVMQLTLSAYMVGIGLGQFVLGPLSDVLGRHKLMVAGNAVFVLASVGIVVAPNIEVVLALRALQGVSGAAGVVIARAAVSDMTEGPVAAQLYSVLALITSLAPVIAPLLGGVIATVADWRAAFWVLAAFGALMLCCSVFVVPESLPPHKRSRGGVRPILRNTATILTDRHFTLYALGFGLSFGALFSYISASSFVFQNVLGFSALGYTGLFALNAAGSIVVATVNTKLVATRDPRNLLLVGVTGVFVTAVANLVLVLVGVVGVPTLVLLFLTQACTGLILGNCVALAQRYAQRHRLAGTGSAVVGMCQFLTAGIVSPLSGLAGEHSAVPMVVCMSVCATLALGVVLAARREADTTAS